MIRPSMALLYFLSGSGVLACDAIGGALPIPSCPSEVKQSWWNGTWATREQDGHRKLTALTQLSPDGTYTTTLSYDDGTKIKHWGSYEISFDKDLKSSMVSDHVSVMPNEVEEIHQGVQIGQQQGIISSSFGGALPSPKPEVRPCLHGTISYTVRGNSPGFSFKSPQSYNFTTQGDGYVRVSGNGADNVLARKYH